MQTLATLSDAEIEAAVAGGIAGSMIGTLTVVALVMYILLIIASWKIFQKAGEPGWKALIPIYNVYIMFKIVKMKNWFWWILCINICAAIMVGVDMPNFYNMTNDQLNAVNWNAHPMTLIALFGNLIAEIWAAIVYAGRTSKVFGHGILFAIGLFFLPNIFWLVLGFDKSKYNKKALSKK